MLYDRNTELCCMIDHVSSKGVETLLGFFVQKNLLCYMCYWIFCIQPSTYGWKDSTHSSSKELIKTKDMHRELIEGWSEGKSWEFQGETW